MNYVMSDIHGNKRRFDSIMEQINLRPEDHLYVIGDVIDRHPYDSTSSIRSSYAAVTLPVRLCR